MYIAAKFYNNVATLQMPSRITKELCFVKRLIVFQPECGK